MPDGLCVRYNDTTREHGLYALQDFEAGHNFGRARVQSNNDPTGRIDAEYRWPLSAFVNCDDRQPNCMMITYEATVTDRTLDLVSQLPIKVGDELTVSYTLTEYGTPGDRPWD